MTAGSGRAAAVIDAPLDWRALAAVAGGAALTLSPAAWRRVETARAIVEAIVERGLHAYGVSTGVGALSDVIVDRSSQRRLSRNILMSHACGVGAPLEEEGVRAVIAAQVNNFAHGGSGVRPETVGMMLALLQEGVTPEIPHKGSAGYLMHMAHVGLVLVGEGHARIGGERLGGRQALARIGLEPLALEAKEGLSLVNGAPCSAGLAALALARAEPLLDWADAVAALTLEALGAQMTAFGQAVLAARPSKGLLFVGEALRRRLAGSKLVERARGVRTQDALSLRAVPHVHGAARDVFDASAAVVDRELASVTDNPMISGTPEAPVVSSEAHAVAPALGQALDALAVAVAQVAAMSERRLERLINPLVSGLPAFLATDPGAGSGFMIAQYTATALVAENRRLASPASLDGGTTSALQEDFLAHPTAAANKLLAILGNAAQILAIELLAAAEAHDILSETDAQASGAAGASEARRAPGTEAIHALVRAGIERYADDRPLAPEMERAKDIVLAAPPPPAVAVAPGKDS